MNRVLAGVATVVLSIAGVTACSGSGGDGDDNPTPVGGINGPARVNPDSGGANLGGSDD